MRIEDFDQIQEGYRHIYLSPHLDDAALSCHAFVARYRGLAAVHRGSTTRVERLPSS